MRRRSGSTLTIRRLTIANRTHRVCRAWCLCDLLSERGAARGRRPGTPQGRAPAVDDDVYESAANVTPYVALLDVASILNPSWSTMHLSPDELFANPPRNSQRYRRAAAVGALAIALFTACATDSLDPETSEIQQGVAAVTVTPI